jgi:hypothetical protein
MAQEILLLEPDAAPLTVITKNINKKATVNPKFQWLEDELDPRFDRINNGAGYASGATSIVVDNGAYFEVQQIVYVTRTKESMRVTAVAGTNTLTVVRGVGSTAQALVDNDELLIANTAQPEGDVSRVARTRNPCRCSTTRRSSASRGMPRARICTRSTRPRTTGTTRRPRRASSTRRTSSTP